MDHTFEIISGDSDRDIHSSLSRVIYSLGWESEGYDRAVIPCGSLWLPVISLARGDEVNISWMQALPKNIFGTRSELITSVIALRTNHKDVPHCHELEEYTLGCRVQLWFKTEKKKRYLEICCVGCPMIMGSTDRRIPFEYLWCDRFFTSPADLRESRSR